MAQYSAKICPFCKASGIIEKNGVFKCRYCLEEFQYDSGGTSLGFSLLQAGDFAAAKKLFEQDSSPTGAYGLFLAETKIDENRQTDGRIKPIIYSNNPESFNGNVYFLNAKKRCENSSVLTAKLNFIEEVRAKDFALSPCDILLVCPDTESAATAYLSRSKEVLNHRSYRLRETQIPTMAEMRSGRVIMLFAFSASAAESLYKNKVAERFLKIESDGNFYRRALLFYSGAQSVALKNLMLSCESFDLSDGDIGGILAKVVLPRAGGGRIELGGSNGGNFAIETKQKQFKAFVRVKELSNEAADISYVSENLRRANYGEAQKTYERLKNDGCNNSEFFALGLMLYSHTASKENYLSYLVSEQGASITLVEKELLAAAISHSTSLAAAEEYAKIFLNAALTLITKGYLLRANEILSAVLVYKLNVSDDYAEKMMNALKLSASHNEFFIVMQVFDKITSSLKTTDAAFQFSSRCWFVSFALSKKQFDAAEGYNNQLLSSRTDTITMFNRLYIINKVSNKEEMYAKQNIVLGDAFKQMLSALDSSESVLTCLKFHFDLVLSKAAAYGVSAYDEILYDLFTIKTEGKGLTSDYAVKVGDAALSKHEFALAKKYYAFAVEEDADSYKGYFGLLCAQLCVADDAGLEDCETDFTNLDNYYKNAYKAAHLKGDAAFCERLVRISARRNKTVRENGHVYRAEDYEISDGRIVKYKGKTADKIFIPPEIVAISRGAFWGNDTIVSVLISGVKAIEDEAFAFCGNLEQVYLPDSIEQVGINPFAVCPKLTAFGVNKNFRVEDGVLYFENRAVTAMFLLPAQTTQTTPIMQTTQNAVINMQDAPTAQNTKINVQTAQTAQNIKINTQTTQNVQNAPTAQNIVINMQTTQTAQNATTNNPVTSITIAGGTQIIGAKCFYNIKTLKTVTLPQSINRIELCAFYGSGITQLFGITEGITTVTGALGDGVFGNKILSGNNLSEAGGRWESLLGGRMNNFASDEKNEYVIKDSIDTKKDDALTNEQFKAFSYTPPSANVKTGGFKKEKVLSLKTKLDGGVLIKNDRLILTGSGRLMSVPIKALFSKSAGDETMSRAIPFVDMGSVAVGTGCLVGDYTVIPLDESGCTLGVFNASGKRIFSLPLSAYLTKSIMNYEGYIICVCGKALVIANIFSTQIRTVNFSENVSCVPTLILPGDKTLAEGSRILTETGARIIASPKIITATSSSVYEVELLTGNKKIISPLSGLTIGTNTQSKICRDRIVAYNERAFWIEKSLTSFVLTEYDGKRTVRRNIPQALASMVIAQPMFSRGAVYIPVPGGVLFSPVSGEDEWIFNRLNLAEYEFNEAAVIAGETIFAATEGEGCSARFKAIYKNAVIAVDAAKGDIYAIRI